MRPEIQRHPSKIKPALMETIIAVVNGKRPWPLVLTGGVGTGKTCAALCVADIVSYCRYRTLEEFCEEIISYQQGNEYDVMGNKMAVRCLWDRVKEPRILTIIDEVGTRDNVTDHQYSSLYRAIEYRIGKSLIVISNKPLGGENSIATIYDDRIASRLAAGTVVECGGGDRRIEALAAVA